MENEYKFVSKFIEGKTYKELTPEEIEKLKSGVGVKKEDKEYIDSLENLNTGIVENESNSEIVNINEQKEDKKENDNKQPEFIKSPNEIVDTKEDASNSKKAMKVIHARGNVLTLEDNRVVTLTKKELNEKPFWHKGDVYYG